MKFLENNDKTLQLKPVTFHSTKYKYKVLAQNLLNAHRSVTTH